MSELPSCSFFSLFLISLVTSFSTLLYSTLLYFTLLFSSLHFSALSSPSFLSFFLFFSLLCSALLCSSLLYFSLLSSPLLCPLLFSAFFLCSALFCSSLTFSCAPPNQTLQHHNRFLSLRTAAPCHSSHLIKRHYHLTDKIEKIKEKVRTYVIMATGSCNWKQKIENEQSAGVTSLSVSHRQEEPVEANLSSRIS